MDFTREPIVESVITPKEGCKIVVRSSKTVGQEEYFVDALEIVSFGNAIFFRSMEKPKAFLVPASDYEVLEVREARMVLKNVGLDRSIKIGGGREPKAAKEPVAEKEELVSQEAAVVSEELATAHENRAEKKRDRRRQQRRRRGREEITKEEQVPSEISKIAEGQASTEEIQALDEGGAIETHAPQATTPSFLSSLLPPPPTLISETIGRYKDLYKSAFYSKEEVEAVKEEEKEEQEEILSKGIQESIPPIKEGEEPSSPFATFWDDIAEPVIPFVPFPEEERPAPEEPLAPEENKE